MSPTGDAPQLGITRSDLAPLRRWKGDRRELEQVLARLSDDAPNERLIRHYAQEEVISRPDARDGTKAIFDFRHIVECLLVKVLVAQGWPLARIADLRRTATVDELVDYLPLRGRNRAEKLVEEFAKRRGAEAPKPALPPSALRRMAEMTLDQTGAPAFAAAAPAGAEEFAGVAPAMLRFELASWCRIEVEIERLSALREADIDQLTERFRMSLRRYRRGGGTK